MINKKRSKDPERLFAGIFLILINFSLQLIDYLSCKQSFNSKSCMPFHLNYGLIDSLFFNLLLWIGIYLIVSNNKGFRLKDILKKNK